MKKFYSAAICALAGMSIIAGIMGTSRVTVYAVEEIADDAMEESLDESLDENLDENLNMDNEATAASGYESISTADGRTVSGSIADDIVPLLFHKSTATYQGMPVESVEFDNGDIVLLYVTDAGGNSCFMRYDSSTGALSDFRMIPGPSDNYIMIMEPDETVEAPAGYEKAVLDWNGQTLTAYVSTAAVTTSETFAGSDAQPTDYFLLYGLSSNGRTGFYLYDQVEGTYQRYLDLASVGLATSSSSGKLIDFAAVSDGDRSALVRLIVVAVMAVIIVLLIVTVIILAIKLKDYAGYEYIDEEDYNAINGVGAGASESAAELQRAKREYADKPDEDETPVKRPARTSERTSERAASKSDNRYSEKQQPPRRRNLLETGDIADLDDILNDPDSTSNLPSPEEVNRQMAKKEEAKREAKRKPAAESKKPEADYENMQVTVDSFSPGMPAMVDTDIIAEDIGEVDSNNRTPSGHITGEMEFARDQYSDQQYDDDYYYNGGEDVYASDEDYYGLSRRERKALEKQRRREEKEAEKDAKYLEKERKRAEKRKKYGYEEPTAMDWTAFSEGLSEESDDRKPKGNDADKMPSYMSDRAKSEGSRNDRTSSEASSKATESRKMAEEERAEAAADAVIRAARGDSYSESDIAPEAMTEDKKREDDYKSYRQGARSQYEEFRRLDEEEEARRAAIEANGRGNAKQTQSPPQPPQPPKVEYTQDLDEDFEFEFLNIKRPQ